MYQYNNLLGQSPGKRSNKATAELKFNGRYLSDEITGYQQLHVGGRSLISRKLATSDVPLRSGAWFDYVQDEMRTIKVTFKLTAETSADMREKYAKLNRLLRSEEPVPFKFDDEPNWIYYGVYTEAPNDPEQALSFVSSFELVCPNPFKIKEEIQSGSTINGLESDFVYPDKITLTVSAPTTDIEITNGEQRIVLAGHYAAGNVITINYGDEVTIENGSNNILYELQQFSDLELFKLKNGMTVTSKQGTVTVEWRDNRL